MRLSFCLLLILFTPCLNIHAYAIDTDLTGQEPRIEDESSGTSDSFVQGTTEDGNLQSSTEGEIGTSTDPPTQTAMPMTTAAPYTETTVRTTRTTRTTITTTTVTRTTITTTTTTTTTEPPWTKEPSPSNPTWAIVGGLIGGIGGLGLIGIGVGVYMCFRASQQRNRSRVRPAEGYEDIPLESSDNF